MVRIVVALILIAHGIGHVLGPLQVLKVTTSNPAWQGDSWLLSGLGPTVSQIAGLILWTAALVGFLAVGAVVMGWLPGEWWTPLAMGSALVSLVGIVLFPLAFPTLSTVGALAVDVVVLFAIAWLHWTPATLAD